MRKNPDHPLKASQKDGRGIQQLSKLRGHISTALAPESGVLRQTRAILITKAEAKTSREAHRACVGKNSILFEGMKCPHCTVEIHAFSQYYQMPSLMESNNSWYAKGCICPACRKAIIWLGLTTRWTTQRNMPIPSGIISEQLAIPKGASRPPCPTEVPDDYAGDYNEACLVLSDSPKASAALSRRCLQHIIRNVAGIKRRDLFQEIQDLIDSKVLPSHISESLDAIRNIGNFAAHPLKSTNTGEIIPVEPAEAEWNLDVLESLFDFYFVEPARTKARKDALNKKLAEAGKPLMP